jgi:outer membrane receptor protein involved in Fe transport
LRSAAYTNNSGTIDTDTLSLTYGDTAHIAQEGERIMFFYSNSLNAGLDYDLNDKNTIGFELEGGITGRSFDSDLDNREWTSGNPETLSYALAETRAKGKFGAFTLSQYAQFGDNKEHKLESSLFFQKYNSDDDTYSIKEDDAGQASVTQETWEKNNSNELRFSSDYTRPGEQGNLEAGYQLRIDDSWSNYDAKFVPVVDNSSFYNEYSFYRMINSVYSTFSGESGQLGYQLGLRAEHTLRQLEDLSNSTNEINRWDYYPTLHLSYNLSEEHSLMTSYTRRIDRPRSYWLDPYVMWRDANNVRMGNPDLQPQYIDSYELSYQLRFGENNYLSVEGFYRHVADKIERTRSKYQDGVIMMAFENVGEDYSTGVELMLNYNITKWWEANLSGSLYDYRINVIPEFSSVVRETQSNNYRGRLSNTFKPSKTLRIQFDAMYKSSSVTATGTNGGVFFSSLAVKKSFFKRKLDIGISLIDCFNTAQMGMYGSGDSYYSDYYFDMNSPYLQFNLTYVFNNYKPERKKKSDSGSSVGMDF